MDVEAEKARIAKEIDKIAKEIARSEAKLNNASFVQRAPAEVVQQEQARLSDWKGKMQHLIAMQAALS